MDYLQRYSNKFYVVYFDIAPSSFRLFRETLSHMLQQEWTLIAMDTAVTLVFSQVEIRPLHSSILGQDHCFQIRASNGSTRYYSCRTQEERNKWIHWCIV